MNELSPSQKIKVFISSKCDKAGDTPKYNPIREELKKLIESTNLATVYAFENESASTLSAGSHYTYALEDSDVCIFLIDNADGISKGVQEEIDTVRKKNKMALYYFCDENSAKKTELEKSLEGATNAKSKTVHHFGELSQNSAQALLDDITLIYHYYCTNRLKEPDKDEIDSTKEIDIQQVENYQGISIPKFILKNIDKSIEYMLKTTADYRYYRPPEKKLQTSELDDWSVQFLSVLLEGKSIKTFNTSLFLSSLEKIQTAEFHNVIALRWQAIQSYFSGDIQECINNLNSALSLAKSTNQASWLINDILIDLRNQHWEQSALTNTFSESEAQKSLDNNEEELYYPVMDRINESLQEKYIQGIYKKKTTSPYTIELGGNLDQLGKLLTSAYIIALYNGSLTHIILFYDRVKDFLFYLSNRYDEWEFKRNLLKYAIFNGDSKEAKGIIDAYPEILKQLSANEARSIIEFAAIHPIKYKRQIRKLIAFGKIGYYLDDANFEKYEKEIVEEIEEWVNDDKPVVNVGQYIFESLSEVSYRMSQDTLARICCLFMEKHFSRWYGEMFKFMAKGIDLDKMSIESAKNLIAHIILVLKNKNECEQVTYSSTFLSIFRRQNKALTEDLDKQISESLPNFYNFYYKLETTENKMHDYPIFVEKLIARVHQNNFTQGKNGTYFEHGTRDIAGITSILKASDFNYSTDLMDNLISTSIETLITSKESVLIKLDATLLLCCIAIKYPQDYLRNKTLYQSMIDRENEVYVVSDPILFSNVSSLALKIGLKMLFSLIGKDIYADMMELLPVIIKDTATTITVTGFIADYLEMGKSLMFQRATETILLHNTFEWLQMDYTDVRWNATRIILTLSRNKENADIINKKILSLIESDNVFIKNLILRKLNEGNLVSDEIEKQIFAICENDSNFVTRMVCQELKDKTNS